MKRLLHILVVAAMLMLLLGTALPAQAATPLEIGNAIDNGLAWLATQQNPNGSFGGGYPLADTASAVLAFEDEGHFPGGATPYHTVVEKGLDYIFLRGHSIAINNQTVGYAGRNDNPDTNGNGQGIYFQEAGNTYNYETGMVMLAIVASTTPARLVTTGPLAGKTYAEVIQDMVDYVAWGQIDGNSVGGRGGWRYEPESNADAYGDNSVAQWPVLGLVAAQQWGFNAPQFVKNELNYWIDYVQNDVSGGSGYSGPDDYVNSSKTGGLLIEMYYVGDNKTTVRALAALNFINTHWNDGLNGWYGNKAHPYAMFATFKGLELMGVATIPNALPSPETPAGDWWGDYCEYLVNNQYGPGYWDGYYYWPQWMSTAWYIIILQSTLFPIQVAVDVPASACGPYTVNINYTSERFWVSGTVMFYKDSILQDTVTLTNFHGTATWTRNIASDTPGLHEWKGVMDVTPVTGGAPIHAENAASVLMCQNPPGPVLEVGGDVYPANKLVILTPWLVLAIVITVGTTILIRRRQNQS